MENKIALETTNMEMVTISRAEYEDLKAQNQWLLEQLRVLKRLSADNNRGLNR